MTTIHLTLELPEKLFDPLNEIAKAKSQPIEVVLLDQLRTVLGVELPELPVDETQELAAYKSLSDDTLHAIAREQMLPTIQARMQTLMNKNTMGTIDSSEYAELAALVDSGQRLTLRKAWAAGILMERGYDTLPQDIEIT